LPIPPGTPLSMEENSVYPAGKFKLDPGDLVVLFTDGLYEVEGPAHEPYGEERLLKAIRKRIQKPPAILFDELLAEIQQFSASKKFDDDMCLLGMDVVRFIGKSS